MERNKMGKNVVSFRQWENCSEPSVVCMGDTEDSQRGVSCNNQDMKGRNKSVCGTCGQKKMDGTNAAEFKVRWAHQIGDLGFHGQVAVKDKVLDRVCVDKGTDALPTVIESGKGEERDLEFLPEDTRVNQKFGYALLDTLSRNINVNNQSTLILCSCFQCFSV